MQANLQIPCPKNSLSRGPDRQITHEPDGNEGVVNEELSAFCALANINDAQNSTVGDDCSSGMLDKHILLQARQLNFENS